MYHLTQYRVALVKDSTKMMEGVKRISNALDRNPLLVDLCLLDREQLRTYFLNCRPEIISWKIVSQRTLTTSLAHLREIFKGACLANAAGIILAHNHPSGNPTPSDEDRRLTKCISQAGQIMGIELLDHIIIGESDCYSFKQEENGTQ